VDEFFERLKQRKLVQWALAYFAGSFALIQVLDIVALRFGWPEQTVRFLIIALAIGFFVVLVLAWYHGERGTQRVSGTELLILALLLTIGGAVIWRLAPTAPSGSTAREAAAKSTSVVAAPVDGKSIAVLPFDNLSRDPDNAYFAEGIQDEILTRLAGIRDLKVISRTSTKRYESKPDNLKSVGAELGVAHILEGSVQKAGDAVRINVQLIDARNDAHLWAQTYDRELKNVFAVESEVSQQIADVLKAQLSPQETSALAKAPTQNAAAYDQFLKAEYQAHKALDSLEETDYLSAEAEYRKVLELDPGFALAYARLAFCQMGRHWNVRPLSAAQLTDVKVSVDRALQLAPDLAEAHLALGYYYYWGYRRYDEASQEFTRALQLAPSNAQALSALAFIHRRKGEWEQALASMRKALVISPRDANLIDENGITYALQRRYAEAEQQLTRALAIDPEDSQAKDWLWTIRLFGRGDVQGARAAFDPPPGWRIGANSVVGGEVCFLINPRVYPYVYERHFDQALSEWDSAPVHTDAERLTRRAARVAIQVIANRQQTMQSECTQLKTLLDAQLAKDPQASLATLQQVSWVDVCLGRNEDAIAAAHRAVDLLPVAKDAYFGTYELSGLAEIDTYAGAPDEALKLIEQLLAIPAGSTMTIERLKHDPLWDPLRKDPRFEKLIRNSEAAAAPVSATN
jgi:TolB-like protein/Tfp pilus assembly protein PilF